MNLCASLLLSLLVFIPFLANCSLIENSIHYEKDHMSTFRTYSCEFIARPAPEPFTNHTRLLEFNNIHMVVLVSIVGDSLEISCSSHYIDKNDPSSSHFLFHEKVTKTSFSIENIKEFYHYLPHEFIDFIISKEIENGTPLCK